jgi:hypothetical protein
MPNTVLADAPSKGVGFSFSQMICNRARSGGAVANPAMNFRAQKSGLPLPELDRRGKAIPALLAMKVGAIFDEAERLEIVEGIDASFKDGCVEPHVSPHETIGDIEEYRQIAGRQPTMAGNSRKWQGSYFRMLSSKSLRWLFTELSDGSFPPLCFFM